MPLLAAEQFAPMLGIVLAAYFIRGISGAGSALVAVPLLAHLLPLKTVVPLVLLLDYSASVALSRATPGQADLSELRRLLPASAVGIVIGIFLLLRLPQAILLAGLGIFVALFGLRGALGRQDTRPISAGWSTLAGLSGGAIGIVFGTGGPPYLIYLMHRLRDKSVLRATLSRLFLVEGSVRIVAFLATGLLLDVAIWQLAGIGVIAVAAGLWAGNRIHGRLSTPRLFRFVGVLLLCSGLSLLAKALAAA